MVGGSVKINWIKYVVKKNERQRNRYNKDRQPVGHFGMAGDETFQETGYNKKRNCANHDLQTCFHAFYKGGEPGVSTGKKYAFANHQSCTGSHNDHRDLD